MAAAVREAVARVEERLGDDLVSAVGALKRKLTAELGAAHAKALEAAVEAEKARHRTELASALAASAQELAAAQELASAQELAAAQELASAQEMALSQAAAQQQAAVAAARVALRADLEEARTSGEGRPRGGYVVNDRVAVLWNVDAYTGRGDWFRGVVKSLRSELDEKGRSSMRLYVVYDDKAVEWIDPDERIMVYAWQTRAMGLLEQSAQQRPPQRQGSPAAAWDTPATHSTKAGRATSVKSEPLTPHGTPAGAAQLASCSSCAALPSPHTSPLAPHLVATPISAAAARRRDDEDDDLPLDQRPLIVRAPSSLTRPPTSLLTTPAPRPPAAPPSKFGHGTERVGADGYSRWRVGLHARGASQWEQLGNGGVRMEVASCDADHEGEWDGAWDECYILAERVDSFDVRIVSDGQV